MFVLLFGWFLEDEKERSRSLHPKRAGSLHPHEKPDDNGRRSQTWIKINRYSDMETWNQKGEEKEEMSFILNWIDRNHNQEKTILVMSVSWVLIISVLLGYIP